VQAAGDGLESKQGAAWRFSLIVLPFERKGLYRVLAKIATRAETLAIASLLEFLALGI